MQSLKVLKSYVNRMLDQDSLVGEGARYGMDGPGIESRCRREFPHLSRPALGPTQPPTQFVILVSKTAGTLC